MARGWARAARVGGTWLRKLWGMAELGQLAQQQLGGAAVDRARGAGGSVGQTWRLC